MKVLRGARAPEGQRALPLVLYVEDNDANWDVVRLRLGRSYGLIHARTDREACELLTREHGKLAAVLMDIELAGSKLNGIQLTRLIRGALPQAEIPYYAATVPSSKVPILFVSAYGSAYRNDELLAAGANDVLAKPVDFTRLSLALTRFHLERASARRH